MAWERFNFTDDMQEQIIACFLNHHQEFEDYGHIVKAEFFNGVAPYKLVTALEDFAKEYGRWPKTFTVLGNYAQQKLRGKNPQEAEDVLELCRRIASIDTSDWQPVRDLCLNFAKERATLQAVKKIHWHITEGKTDQIDPVRELGDALTAHQDCSDLVDARGLLDTKLPLPAELVEGLIHGGTKVMLGGASKAWKSWSLMAMAVAVATGTNWYGRKCRQGNVLYLNFEIPDEWFQQRLAKLEQAMEVNIEPGRLIVAGLRGKNRPMSKTINMLLGWTRGDSYALVIIDPIYKLFIPEPRQKNVDENSAGDIAQALNQLDRVTVQTGAAVAWAGHYAKGDAGKKSAIDRVSGSGVFSRDADSIIMVTEHQDDKSVCVVEPILRNFPPAHPFCVRWQHPLFVPAPEYDPERVKTGSRESRYNDGEIRKPLMESTEPLGYGEWFDKLKETGISKRTFARRVAGMVGRTVIKTGDKYMPMVSDEAVKLA